MLVYEARANIKEGNFGLRSFAPIELLRPRSKRKGPSPTHNTSHSILVYAIDLPARSS